MSEQITITITDDTEIITVNLNEAARGATGEAGSSAEVTTAAVRAAVPNLVEVASPANDDMIQRVGGSWVTRTIAQIKTALGLGSAAYTASTDYATAAQGTLAASASQPGHTHVSADITNSSEGGNNTDDAAKLLKFGSDGSIRGSSVGGNGLNGSAISGAGLSAISSVGTNHATFGITGDDRSFIRRVLGLIGWHRGVYTQTLGSPATLSANSAIELPDVASGTVALTSNLATYLPLAGGTMTGALVNTTNGATSAPAVQISGVPFAGTGTTSFPLVYINDANATASTTLNTAGTYFGVNGDGNQDLCNFLKDGTSVFKVESTGSLTLKTQILVSGADGTYPYIRCGSGTQQVLLTADANYGYLQTSGNNKPIQINGTWVEIPSGLNVGGITDPGDGNITASGTIKLGAYTVATLPTPAVGMTCYVTDANATTFASIVAGGGANIVPVFYNGTNWIIS